MALDHSCQVQRHPLSERGNDAYMTPPCATEALLRVEKDLPRRIWECACGDGTGILDVLRAAGHEVIGSDIGNFGRPDCFWERDFLGETRMPAGCTTIVTNPPYKLCARSAPFVRHALDIADTVILLMRLAFYESRSRTEILEHRGLRSIRTFTLRLPMMHRDSWCGRKANSGMAFCWMRWDRGYIGPTIISRISWER